LRRVNWKATARQGRLQVRVLESSAAPALLLVLPADSFDVHWSRYRQDMFELAASALASISWRAIEDGWPVGLIATGRNEAVLPPAASPGQLPLILEALAAAEPGPARPLASLLPRVGTGLGRATCVLALGRTTPSVLETLARLRPLGMSVAVLSGERPDSLPVRARSYRLSAFDDLAATLEGPGELVSGT
jgi:uncharacterized protein (DUF58 family)